MDKKQFDKHINDLLIIKRTRTGRNPKEHVINFNPVIEPRHIPKPCEDCGRMVAGRRINYYINWIDKPSQHWLKQCINCKHKEKITKIRD